jgi:hypothetical protein
VRRFYIIWGGNSSGCGLCGSQPCSSLVLARAQSCSTWALWLCSKHNTHYSEYNAGVSPTEYHDESLRRVYTRLSWPWLTMNVGQGAQVGMLQHPQ